MRRVLQVLGSALAAGLAATSARATPPTPPARLVLPDAATLAALAAREGFFVLSPSVQVSGEVRGLSIVVRTSAVDALAARELEARSYNAPVKPGSPVEIKLPVRGKPGRYRVEIELVGEVEGKKGVIDRVVLFQVEDEKGARLQTPVERRREDDKQRQQAFLSQLRQAPDRPESRLLSPDTVTLPQDLAARVARADKPRLLVRGDGPPRALAPYLADKRAESWESRDPLTIHGRVTFVDFEGTWRPLVNVSVNLYDEDTFGDEHLATTVTDWNGDWSFSVNNDDGFLQDGRDIYYTFHLGNTRWVVRDDDGDDYVWQSAVHDDLDDGSIVDFGTETGSTDPESMQIFAVLNLGWDHIVGAGGQDPGHVEARFPESRTGWSPSEELLRVEMGFSDGPDVTLHEYGHALMYRAFSGNRISPGGPHDFDDDTQDPGLAYSEGWGTGYMLSVCPDGAFNWHEGNTEAAGEWPGCSVQNDFGRNVENFSDAGNRVGERNEGRVAAALSDFRDSPNDGNGGSENRGRNGEQDANAANRISLATIYRDNMWGLVHQDFLLFWIAFAGDLADAARTQADDIMQYNWMSLPIELNCVASKIATAERPDRAELLAGLRAFRDHALKPNPAGRRLMQSYYSHSPELALLLIGDADARAAALEIVEHFAGLGRAIASRQTMRKLLEGDSAVLPARVGQAAGRVMALIERQGSEELRRELPPLRDTLASFEAVSVAEAVRRAERQPAAKAGYLEVVDPHRLAPASRKADWKLIRSKLPPDVGGDGAAQQQ